MKFNAWEAVGYYTIFFLTVVVAACIGAVAVKMILQVADYLVAVMG